MSLSIDAASSHSGTGTSLSWSHICTGSNLALVVGVSFRNSGAVAISDVTYNGVSLTEIRHDVTGGICSGLWCLDGPVTGTHDIEVTLSASAKLVGGGISLTGFGSLGVNSGGIGHDLGSAFVTLSPVADSVIVGCCSVLDGVIADAGTDYTERWDISEGSSDKLRGAGLSKGISSGGEIMVDWTLGASTDWAASVVEVKA